MKTDFDSADVTEQIGDPRREALVHHSVEPDSFSSILVVRPERFRTPAQNSRTLATSVQRPIQFRPPSVSLQPLAIRTELARAAVLETVVHVILWICSVSALVLGFARL
jgi:hypothetical protein